MKKFNCDVGGRAIFFNLTWNMAMTLTEIQAGFKQTGI